MVGIEKRYSRIGQRYLQTVFRWFIILCLFISAYVFCAKYLTRDTGHYGVLEIGDPILVYWWNNDDKQFSQIKIPADAYSLSQENYHQYSLKSLWKLGQLDNNNQLILNQHISLTFNLPVKWYVSGSGINKIQTNMPLQLYVSYIWHKLFTDKTTILKYDFTQSDFFNHQMLADGRDVLYLNSDKIESWLSHNFELESVRRENLKVAVLNATEVSGLGDKMSKIFNRLGIYVGTVSNVSSTINSCQMIGRAAALKSQTANIIQNIFQCSLIIRQDDKPYDLEILVGSSMFPFLQK